MPPNQYTWPHCEVVKVSFWAAVSKLTLGATAPLKNAKENDKEVYQTLFEDKSEGEDIFNRPQFLLRMYVKPSKLHGRLSV